MPKHVLGWFVIGSALIWGLSILAAALMMPDIECKTRILGLLGTAAALHLILIWGTLAVRLKKIRDTLEGTGEV